MDTWNQTKYDFGWVWLKKREIAWARTRDFIIAALCPTERERKLKFWLKIYISFVIDYYHHQDYISILRRRKDQSYIYRMIISIIIITHFHCLIVPLSVQTIQNENKHFCSIVIFKQRLSITIQPLLVVFEYLKKALWIDNCPSHPVTSGGKTVKLSPQPVIILPVFFLQVFSGVSEPDTPCPISDESSRDIHPFILFFLLEDSYPPSATYSLLLQQGKKIKYPFILKGTAAGLVPRLVGGIFR